jgi:integrase
VKIKQHSNGIYYAHVWTSSGVRSISLKTRNKMEAAANAKAAKIADLESAAKVNALTAETVSRILVGRKQTGSDAFTAWKDWAQLVGLTRNTQARYSTYIARFLRDSGFITKSLAGAKDTDVDAFVNPVDAIVANTRRNRLCAIQSFFAVALAKGFVAFNPTAALRVKMDGLTFAQKEAKVRVPFTDDEVAILRTIEDPFWKTFVLLGENFGLRVGDVAQLERASIAKPGVLVIYTDKRDRRIEMPMSPEVRNHLESLPVTDKTYFFPEQREIAIDTALRSKLSTYFGRVVQRLGIEGKNTHCLRHSFATKRAGLGDTVDEIRMKLGHESEVTTAGYIHT